VWRVSAPPSKRESLPAPGSNGRRDAASHVASEHSSSSPALLPFSSSSPKMRVLASTIRDVASTDATVLIQGESGVGKNLVARAIHATSPRSARPFVLVNCAALPSELLESELFGHEKGAFTGAYRRTLGKFEFANGGTLCLDEIGELPRPLQAKLLHVLQDFQFTRVGGRELIRVDVRVIATTNRDLQAAMRDGHFREDLYYRLNVVDIHVPPLRDRPETIRELAQSFVAQWNEQYSRQVELSPELLALLGRYPWPGNVRELENFTRRLVVLGDPERAHRELEARISSPRAPSTASGLGAASPAESASGVLDLKRIGREAARDAERRALIEVLERVRWNRAEAARILKVSYKTLLNKLAECGIPPRRPRREPAAPDAGASAPGASCDLPAFPLDG
jgi:two-component system response regulator AtoC